MSYPVEKLHEFVAHNTAVNCLTFGPVSNQVVATGGEDFNVNVWRVGDASNVWTLGQNKSPIECLRFDSDEQCIVSGAVNGSLKVFDLTEGRLARSLAGHQVHITALDYHPYGEYIASGSTDTTMKVWDVRNKTCIQTYTGHEKEVTCVRFSPDGRWVASAAKDGQMLIWDLVAGKLMHTVKMGPAYITSFEFNPQEFLLAATTSMRTVRLWDMESFELIGSSAPESSPLRALGFAKDGRSLCTASGDVLKVHGWDPVSVQGSAVVGWDKVTEIRLMEDNVALVGSIISNFVSLWTVDISAAVGGGEAQPPAPAPSGRMGRDNSSGVSVPRTAAVAAAPRGEDRDVKAEKRRERGGVDSKPSGNFPEDLALFLDDDKSPSVKWEQGQNAKDLATTMHESFDARQRSKQAVAETKDEVSRKPPQRRYEEEANDEADSASSALERMLPPSSFGGSGGNRGVGVSPLRVRRPAPQVPTSHPSDTNGGRSQAPPSSSGANGRQEMRRGVDPLQPTGPPGGAAPAPASLAVVGSSHGRRRPGGGMDSRPVSSSSRDPKVIAARQPKPKQNYSYESIAEEEASRSAAAAGQEQDQFSTVVEKDGRNFLAAVTQRKSSLSLLRKHWERGEIDDVISHLLSLQVMGQQDPRQLISAADFFNAVELRGHGMNLAACANILPILESMLDGGLECLALASLGTMITLGEVFGDLIRQTRSVMVARGVDLSREDRLQKCNACHVVLVRVRGRLDLLRQKNKKSRRFVEVIERAQNTLDDIC
jgi:WD40 repeat protein